MDMNLNLNTAAGFEGKSLANSPFSDKQRKPGVLPGTEGTNAFEVMLSKAETPIATNVADAKVNGEVTKESEALLEELMKRGLSTMATPTPIAEAALTKVPENTSSNPQPEAPLSQLNTEVKDAGLLVATPKLASAASGLSIPHVTALSPKQVKAATPMEVGKVTAEQSALLSKLGMAANPQRGEFNSSAAGRSPLSLAESSGLAELDAMGGKIEGLTVFEPVSQKAALTAIAAERPQTGAEFVQTLQAAQAPRLLQGSMGAETLAGSPLESKAGFGDRKLALKSQITEGETPSLLTPGLSPEATLATTMLRGKTPSTTPVAEKAARGINENPGVAGKPLRKGREFDQALDANAPAAQTMGATVLGAPVAGSQMKTTVSELFAQTTPGGNTQPRFTSESVVNIGVGLSQMSQKGGGEMRIRLKPENLGELVLKITTQGNQVGLQVMASDDRAKSVIEDSISALKENLASKNLSLGTVDVSVVMPSAGRSDGPDFNAQNTNSNQQAAMQMGEHSSRERGSAQNGNSGESRVESGTVAGRKAMGLRAIGSTGTSGARESAASGRLNVFA